MITRRCSQRTLRLRPSNESNQSYLYCLAWAAAKTGAETHAACVMSNRHPLVPTDVYRLRQANTSATASAASALSNHRSRSAT